MKIPKKITGIGYYNNIGYISVRYNLLHRHSYLKMCWAQFTSALYKVLSDYTNHNNIKVYTIARHK